MSPPTRHAAGSVPYRRGRARAPVAAAALLAGLVLFLRALRPGEDPVPGAPSNAASAQVSPAPSLRRNGAFQARWERWKAAYSGAPNDDALLAAGFEALARENPSRLFRLLQTEPDHGFRKGLVCIALMLWAETDSAAAAGAAETLPYADRSEGVAAVLAGASARPEEALALAEGLCARDPELYPDHGYSLVSALGGAGRFDLALRFAREERAGVDEDTRSKWLKAVFAAWAAKEPGAALGALQRLEGENQRFEALDSYASARAKGDPVGLAETLRAMPEGPERNSILGQALRAWTDADPLSASAWLEKQSPSAVLDPGIAAVASTASRTNRSPEAALSWAESIEDPELRSRTLHDVLRDWAQKDPACVLGYLKTSSDLSPSDRERLVPLLGLPTPR